MRTSGSTSSSTVATANGAHGPARSRSRPIALNDSTPELATARPYAVDLTGWFEGFTHPGTIDANGGSSRVAPVVGVGSVENGALNLLPSLRSTRPCARCSRSAAAAPSRAAAARRPRGF